MGVLACNRKDCDNVMCDRLSSHYGYICDDCFEELVSLGPYANIDAFMDGDDKEIDREESYRYFNFIFSPMRNDDF